jgi:hypothetical protein
MFMHALGLARLLVKSISKVSSVKLRLWYDTLWRFCEKKRFVGDGEIIESWIVGVVESTILDASTRSRMKQP